MKRLFILPVFAVVIFSSCRYMFAKRIYGNGNIRIESRSAGSFNNVDVSGSIDVYAKQDSVSGIKVEADENLMEYIQVIEDGNIVRIRTERGFNLHGTKRIKVYVSSPDFKSFRASGACNIYSENKINSTDILAFDLSGSSDVKMELNSPKVDADLSGACKIELQGETKDFKVDGSGSTDIYSLNLLAENVDIGISGSGDAEVFASRKLDVDVSGSGTIKYKGSATVNQHISGSGSVKKID